MSVRPIAIAVALAFVLSTAAPAARADTRDACIVASETGQELVHASKLREARDRFVACAAATCPGLVRDDCNRHLADIDARQPTIVFQARDAQGAPVTDVRVTIDDGPSVAERLDGATPVPVDPGEHRFTFEAPGFAAAHTTLAIREGEKGRREAVALVASASGSGSGSAAATTGESGPGARRSSPTTAYVAFGIGAAGLVVGGAAGLLGFASASEAKSHCAGNVCTPQAQSGIDAAKRWAIVSDVGFVVAALGVASGVVVLLTRSRAPSTASTELVVGAGAVHVRGRF